MFFLVAAGLMLSSYFFTERSPIFRFIVSLWEDGPMSGGRPAVLVLGAVFGLGGLYLLVVWGGILR